MKLRHSLMSRQVGGFLLLLLLAVSVMGLLVFRQAKTALSEEVLAQLDAAATLKADALTTWLEDQRQTVLLLAASPELRRGTAVLLDKQAAAADQNQAYADVRGFLLDATARKPIIEEILIISVENGQALIATTAGDEGKDFSAESFFSESQAGVVVRKTEKFDVPDELLMTIAIPLLNKNGRQIGGVLVVHFNLENMDRIILNRAGLGENGETYLVDTSHIIISGRRLGVATATAVQNQAIDDALAGNDGSGLYSNFAAEPVIGVYRWLPQWQMALLAELPQTEAFTPARQLAQTIALAGLILAAVLALVVFWLARRMTMPILAVTQTARQLGAGDLDAEAPIMSQDEVGLLAQTFNQMTGQLRDLYHNLSSEVEGHKKTAAALKQSEERFRKAFHTSPDSINLNRLTDGVYLDINQGFTQITGYTREDVIGKSSLTVNIWANPGDRARLVAGLQADGYVQGLEAQFRMKDGAILTGLMSARVIDIGDEKYILSVTRDISHRKKAEMALRESEARFRMIFEHSPLGIFQFDDQRCLVECNEKFIEIIGLTRERLIGIDIWQGVQDARLKDSVQLALTGEISTYEGDYHINTANKIIPVRVTCGPISDKQGEIIGGMGMVEDITEYRLAEESLRQTQKLESLGIMAGGIAHDFNNLLVAMQGHTSLALSLLAVDNPVRPYILKAEKAAARAADLTRQLLAYSKGGQFEKTAVNLNRIIEENLHLFEVAIPKNVRLSSDLNPDLPAVLADAGQIQQIVMNLIINGAEAINPPQPGSVQVSTQPFILRQDEIPQWTYGQAELSPGPHVLLTVTDSGSGMDAMTQSRIFDPFFTTKFTGRGLGLAAVLGIVLGHKGGLQVTSRPGEGATFSILLPAAPAEISVVEPEPPVASASHSGIILVIDDEEPVRDALTDILTLESWQVLTADNGRTGLSLYDTHRQKIDLVILDLSMPGLSGEETLMHLRQRDPAVRVLLSSGYNETDLASRFADLGLAGFLQKPYNVDRLLTAVRAAMS